MFTLEVKFFNDPVHYHATPFYFSGLERAYQEVFEMANKGASEIYWAVVEPVLAYTSERRGITVPAPQEHTVRPPSGAVDNPTVNRGAW